MGLLDEVDGALGNVVVDGLHALLGQRAGIFDAAVGEGVDDAARAKPLAESRVFRIVGMFWLILGV